MFVSSEQTEDGGGDAQFSPESSPFISQLLFLLLMKGESRSRSRSHCVQVNLATQVWGGEAGEDGQILMSWDSTILASVFLTLRMVRREAGL